MPYGTDFHSCLMGVGGFCCNSRPYSPEQRLYVVGSNEQENRFRILKLDRTEPRRLVLLPEATAGSLREIKSILATIEGANAGNSASLAQEGGVAVQKGINKILSAYGIAGQGGGLALFNGSVAKSRVANRN